MVTMKQRILCLFICSLCVGVLAGDPAHAIREPYPISTDNRIKTLVYSPNEVFSYTGNYGYQSSLVFESGEKIVTLSMGDSTAWQMIPNGNRLFLKPVERDAETNMLIITNRRTYHFELHAREAKDGLEDEGMVFEVRFLYPNEQGGIRHSGNRMSEIPDITDEPQNYNFNYSISGPEYISPIRIFDDGEFTYFEFRDINADIPAFFLVDPYGNEAIINFRSVGPYIVVERVSSVFTLRYGADAVCVFNESRPLPKVQQVDE